MVWKKSDDQPTSHNPEPTPTSPRPMASSPAPSNPEPVRRTGDRATIGPSIFIKGDLTGDEDLVIEGRVEGKVDLKQNNVTVGRNGRVRADVFGRVVTVEGEVDGNVFAQEQAILRQAGAIRGNISAPRVILEDGSRFKGSIDMEAKGDTGSRHSSNGKEQQQQQGQGQGKPGGEAASVSGRAASA
jgi:cytoskeletal protein CcmA (bactofilin family)